MHKRYFATVLIILMAGLAGMLLVRSQLGSAVVDVKLSAKRAQVEVAPGTKFNGWTFNGQIPGPVVRVREGDEINFTLRNDDPVMPHSMDFHAAETPWDKSYVDVQPGDSFSYTWQARYPGVFMYHCGTAPALVHIANGMYGAVIVDPKTPRPKAREYVLVQSEIYGDGTNMQQMMSGSPSAVVFNGKRARYMDKPLQAKPGELVRFYVVNAGPNHFSAFHVVGAVFDRVYVDGNPHNVLRGVQTYTIPPGGGAVFELRIPKEGMYPIMSHSMEDAALGAHAMLQVTPQAIDLPLAP